MNIDALKAFIATAETGSFTAAGKRLGKSQAAISKLIANLEIDLNGNLFDRSGRYPTISELGLGIYERSRLLIEQETAIFQQAGMIQAGVESELHIGVDPCALMPQWFDLFAMLALEYPDVIIEISEAPMPELHRRMLDGQLDIVFGPQQIERIDGIQILTSLSINFSAIAAQSHPLSRLKSVLLADLKTELAISYGQVKGMIEKGYRTSLRHWYLNNPQSLAAMVNKGIGFGFVPDFLLIEILKQYDVCVLPLASNISQTYWQYELLARQSFVPGQVSQTIIDNMIKWATENK